MEKFYYVAVIVPPVKCLSVKKVFNEEFVSKMLARLITVAKKNKFFWAKISINHSVSLEKIPFHKLLDLALHARRLLYPSIDHIDFV